MRDTPDYIYHADVCIFAITENCIQTEANIV